MNKAAIAGLSGAALFRHVFGLKEGQSLSQFVAEIKPVREDEKFVVEVREYALANASDA
jgi:hypothetical protein